MVSIVCPVCQKPHVNPAEDLLTVIPDRFSPCTACAPFHTRNLLKRSPLPPSYTILEPCICNRRFIDDVMAHIYLLFCREGVFTGNEDLAGIGMPLPDPGLFLQHPPYLPFSSLILVTSHEIADIAECILREVPELSGIIIRDNKIPGISGDDLSRPVDNTMTHTYTRAAGCDVRADIFPCRAGTSVIYKPQSCMHIEFPRRFSEKIRSVERYIDRFSPRFCIDACSGPGTLGIAAARNRVPEVVCTDAWYAAAFFTGLNLLVNKELLGYEEVMMHTTYASMQQNPVRSSPILVAEAYKDGKSCQVYHGSLWNLGEVLEKEPDLTILDPFDKSDQAGISAACSRWKREFGGEIVVP
ncbi:MAG: hypothetical protein JXA44_13400 [Methanospirillaceae archaeon]|nr:hypothetical protein [Methanospirillaceae archaeon]